MSLNTKLNTDFLSQKGAQFLPKEAKVMVLVLPLSLMMVNNCMKFETNSLNSNRRKVDLNLTKFFLHKKGYNSC